MCTGLIVKLPDMKAKNRYGCELIGHHDQHADLRDAIREHRAGIHQPLLKLASFGRSKRRGLHVIP
jgi:hypothetical protein